MGTWRQTGAEWYSPHREDDDEYFVGVSYNLLTDGYGYDLETCFFMRSKKYYFEDFFKPPEPVTLAPIVPLKDYDWKKRRS